MLCAHELVVPPPPPPPPPRFLVYQLHRLEIVIIVNTTMHIPISEVKKLAYVWSAPYCADALPFRNAYFGEHSSPGTNLTSLLCYGNESRLIDCRHSNKTTCRASRVAGVRCQGKTVAGTFVLWCALAIFSENCTCT